MYQQQEKSKMRKQPESSVFGKVPPQAVDLEKAVLGAILLEKEAIDVTILKPEHFYHESHQSIFKAMKALQKKNSPIDFHTVSQELLKSEELEKIGGPFYLTTLTNGIFSAANIEIHSQIIIEKFIKRELIRISLETVQNAYDDSTDTFMILDEAEKSISEIGVKNISGGMVQIDKVVFDAIKQISVWKSDFETTGNLITGVPSGFSKIDKATRGFQPGDLIILGARPSTGKTAIALNIAINAAKNKIKPVGVAVWSLEMTALRLVLRMLAAESKTGLYNIQTGWLTDEQLEHISDTAAKTLSNLGIYFDEKTNITISSIKRKAKRLHKYNNLGLIIVDYIQLIRGEDKKSREQQVANISWELKQLAGELKIPVIGLSQLSREDGGKAISWEYGPPPTALRESGALEQDADMILMLWKPSDEDIKQDPSISGVRKLRIAKQRDGVLLTEELNFNDEIQLFERIQEIEKRLPSNFRPVYEKEENPF